jgi:uncharacterized protein (TIGR00106 family)
MLLIELSMSPMDKGPSVSKWVARSLAIIDRSGLDYRLGPMGTCIEGEWDEVMAVVKRCWKAMGKDCVRITFSIKGDWRKGAKGRLASKVEAVEKILSKRLRTR